MAGGSEVEEEEEEEEEEADEEEGADEEGQCSARTPSWRHAERCSAVSDAHEEPPLPLPLEKHRASPPPRPHEYRELAAGLHGIERLCGGRAAVPERPAPTAATQLARRC
jgi:hypothetical protein